MGVSIQEFMPRIMQHLAHMPDDEIILNAVRDTVIELAMLAPFFYRQRQVSPALTEFAPNGDGAAEDDQANYKLAAVQDVFLDGDAIRRIADTEINAYDTREVCWNTRGDCVILHNYRPTAQGGANDDPWVWARARAGAPSALTRRSEAIARELIYTPYVGSGAGGAATASTVGVVYSLRPLRTTTEYDEDFFEAYVSVVAYGAITRINQQFWPRGVSEQSVMKKWMSQRNSAVMGRSQMTAARSTALLDGTPRRFGYSR